MNEIEYWTYNQRVLWSHLSLHHSEMANLKGQWNAPKIVKPHIWSPSIAF